MTNATPSALEPTSDGTNDGHPRSRSCSWSGSWIAPLVIYLVKRESRFVSFHALQALLLQIIWMLLGGVLMVGWMVLIFSTIALHPQSSSGPPLPVFLIFPLFWLAWMCLWAGMLVIAIVYGIKAEAPGVSGRRTLCSVLWRTAF